MSEYRRRGESSPTYSRGRTLNGNERDRRCRSRSRSRSNEHPYRKNFYNENSRHGDKLHRTSDDGPLRLTNGDNDTLDRLVAVRIQELAALEVKKYVKSEDFTAMVELFKRRERERILAEIEHELAQEKASLLMEGRSKLALEYVASITQHPTAHHHSIPEAQLKNLTAAEQADAILLQNKLKMEEKQRLNYEAKQKEDAERLQQVLHRKQIEVYLLVFMSKVYVPDLSNGGASDKHFSGVSYLQPTYAVFTKN